MLVFISGYRQVTCTFTSIEQFTPNSVNFQSLVLNVRMFGGIRYEENKS